MKVTIHKLVGWDDDRVVGTFHLRGGRVVCDHPDSALMRNMMDMTVAGRGGESYSAGENPEEWLENLQYQYRSAYLSASPPEAGAGTKSLPAPKPEKPKPSPRPEQVKVEEAPTQMKPPVQPPQLPPPQYAPEEEASPEASLTVTAEPPTESSPAVEVPEPVSETEQRADEIATALAKKAPGIWQKVGGAGKTVKDRMLRFKNWLENRYGKTQTKLILASGSLIGWTATGVGALFGKVVWWPGSMYWGSLPAIAIAEAYMQAKRGLKKMRGEKAFTQSKQYPTLSEQEINQIATRLVYKLIRLSKQEHEKITGGGDRNGFPPISRKSLPMRIKGEESSPAPEKPKPIEPPAEPQYASTPVQPPSLPPSRVVQQPLGQGASAQQVAMGGSMGVPSQAVSDRTTEGDANGSEKTKPVEKLPKRPVERLKAVDAVKWMGENGHEAGWKKPGLANLGTGKNPVMEMDKVSTFSNPNSAGRGAPMPPRPSFALAMAPSAKRASDGSPLYGGQVFLYQHDGFKYVLLKNPKTKSGAWELDEAKIRSEALLKVGIDGGKIVPPEPGTPLAVMYARRQEAIDDGSAAHPGQETLPTGEPIPVGHHMCSRCGGAGLLSQFSHVEGGVCFDCGGAGYQKDKSSRKMLPMRVKQFGEEAAEKPKPTPQQAVPKPASKQEAPKPPAPPTPQPAQPLQEPQYISTPVQPPSLPPSRVGAPSAPQQGKPAGATQREPILLASLRDYVDDVRGALSGKFSSADVLCLVEGLEDMNSRERDDFGNEFGKGTSYSGYIAYTEAVMALEKQVREMKAQEAKQAATAIGDKVKNYTRGNEVTGKVSSLPGGKDKEYARLWAGLDKLQDESFRLDKIADRSGSRADALAAEKASEELFKIAQQAQAASQAMRQVQEEARNVIARMLAGGEHHRLPGRPRGLLSTAQANYDTAKSWLESVVARRKSDPKPPGFYVKEEHMQRAYFNPDKVGIHVSGIDPAEIVHELGHYLEHHVPGIRQAAVAFRSYRVKDEKPTKLKDKFPGEDYADDEKGYEDDFGKYFEGASAYYAGKTYENGDYTEIISMGLEALYENPTAFCTKDPEYAKFIIGILSGELREEGD